MGSFREIDPTQFARYFPDVPYADEDPRQVMDIWLPNEGEGPFPLIVFVHGGGWVSGNKRENTMPGVFKFPSQGYAVACVEYRLVPDVHWPEPLEDVRAAIRYLRAHAAEYNLDAENIAIMGNSAGGHLACMVAALAGRPVMNGRRYGNLDQSDAVQCLERYIRLLICTKWICATVLPPKTRLPQLTATLCVAIRVKRAWARCTTSLWA